MMTGQQIRSFRAGDRRGIPEHMIGTVLRYFNDHLPPGDFLCAVLVNDFMEACGRADERNLEALPVWASFLYQRGPCRQLRER